MQLRCEQCGGELEVTLDHSVGICRYCGSKYTIPKEIEKKGNLFNRANYLRQSCKFDDASEVYKTILTENSEDPDALWGLVLCRYGIEFVQDPKTKSRVPTCHRASKSSILVDPDYKAALRYCGDDEDRRSVFLENAQKIDKIQKEIRKISEREEKFDVFICYKESDENNKRTHDSVLAHQIYDALSKSNIKTFFAKKTLESRIGSEYEPIIYSALNSAKVMIVLGTKPEYFNAPWVRNEWSRYLDFMQDDDSKHLIPAYLDMSPYDLPEEFSSLQALDMSALGFMLDLCDAVKKILKPTIEVQESGNKPSNSRDGLYTRALICLGNRDFHRAVDFFEEILDIDAHFAPAYWGSLLASNQCTTPDELSEYQADDWSRDMRFTYALKYAKNDERQVYEDTLQKYIANFKRFANNALLNGNFDVSADWCEKFLDHDKTEGIMWWMLVLARNKARNAKELYDQCVENLVTLADKREVQNAIRLSDEKERAEYLKIVDRIDGAVAIKRVEEKHKECDKYMQQAIKTMKNRGAAAVNQQLQTADTESKKMTAIRNFNDRYHQNNFFALLFFILCWCIGLYAVLGVFSSFIEFNFKTTYLILCAVMVCLILVIGIAKKVSVYKQRSHQFARLVEDHEIAQNAWIEGAAHVDAVNAIRVAAEKLYKEFNSVKSWDLKSLEEYYLKFREILGNEFLGDEISFEF